MLEISTTSALTVGFDFRELAQAGDYLGSGEPYVWIASYTMKKLKGVGRCTEFSGPKPCRMNTGLSLLERAWVHLSTTRMDSFPNCQLRPDK